MMTLDKNGNYNPWVQPKYGTNAQDVAVVPPDGYRLLKSGEQIQLNDIPFDVYVGWILPSPTNYHVGEYADSSGRWTTWARKI